MYIAAIFWVGLAYARLTTIRKVTGPESRSQTTGNELHSGESTGIAINVPFPVVRSAYIHAFRLSGKNEMSLVQHSVRCTGVVCPVHKREHLS